MQVHWSHACRKKSEWITVAARKPTSLETIWGRLLGALEAKLRDALRRKAEKAEKAGIWWKTLR